MTSRDTSRTVITEEPDHLIFRWGDEKVEANITLMQEDRSHNISGEVRLLLADEQIHRGRLNLTSIQTRKQWQNILQERVTQMGDLHGIDWYAILEELCSEASDIYRRGEPIHVLGDVPEQERISWRLRPILIDGPTLIFGPGSSGKSMLAAYFAVLIQAGAAERDFDTGLVPEPGKVLYLDYETDSYEIASRVRSIQRALGIEDKSQILYRFCAAPIVTEIESIRTIVNEKHVDYIIVDSVGAACGGEPESADSILRYFSALRSLKRGTHQAIGSLSISHTNREGTMFGSAYLTWQARSVFEIKKAQRTEEAFIDCALHHRKANNGKLIAPVGFRITFEENPQAIRVISRNLAEVEKLEGGASMRERLQVLLRDGISRTRDEICDALNINYQQRSNLRSVLSRYKEEFIVDPENDEVRLRSMADAQAEEDERPDNDPNDEAVEPTQEPTTRKQSKI